MEHEKITERVIGCAFRVYNTLGSGFLENVYENALLIELSEAGLQAKSQVKLEVSYRGQSVGHYFADIVVENLLVLELKAVEAIAKAHEAQLVSYLAATGKELGLLINFGPNEVSIRRKVRDLKQLSRQSC